MTRIELDKMITLHALDHALNVGNPSKIECIEDIIEAKRLAYKAGAKFTADILMKEIDRLNDEKPTKDEIFQTNCLNQYLEQELSEQCRINGIGAQRELKLIADIDLLKQQNARYREALAKCRFITIDGCKYESEVARQALEGDEK